MPTALHHHFWREATLPAQRAMAWARRILYRAKTCLCERPTSQQLQAQGGIGLPTRADARNPARFAVAQRPVQEGARGVLLPEPRELLLLGGSGVPALFPGTARLPFSTRQARQKIGRASCRERGTT